MIVLIFYMLLYFCNFCQVETQVLEKLIYIINTFQLTSAFYLFILYLISFPSYPFLMSWFSSVLSVKCSFPWKSTQFSSTHPTVLLDVFTDSLMQTHYCSPTLHMIFNFLCSATFPFTNRDISKMILIF